MHKKLIPLILTPIVMFSFAGCDMMRNRIRNVNPKYVMKHFLISWKEQDWKTMYTYVYPGYIQKLRQSALNPEKKSMTDEELFIAVCRERARTNRNFIIRSYTLKKIPLYKSGDTILWVKLTINGKERHVPLKLSDMALKVDLGEMR